MSDWELAKAFEADINIADPDGRKSYYEMLRHQTEITAYFRAQTASIMTRSQVNASLAALEEIGKDDPEALEKVRALRDRAAVIERQKISMPDPPSEITKARHTAFESKVMIGAVRAKAKNIFSRAWSIDTDDVSRVEGLLYMIYPSHLTDQVAILNTGGTGPIEGLIENLKDREIPIVDVVSAILDCDDFALAAANAFEKANGIVATSDSAASARMSDQFTDVLERLDELGEDSGGKAEPRHTARKRRQKKTQGT